MQFADCALRGVRLQENAVGRRGAPRVGRDRDLDRLVASWSSPPSSFPDRSVGDFAAGASVAGRSTARRARAATCGSELLPPLASFVPASEPARAFEVDLQGDPSRSPGRGGRSRGSDRGGRAAEPCRMNTCVRRRARSRRPRSTEHRRRAEEVFGRLVQPQAWLPLPTRPPCDLQNWAFSSTQRAFLQQRPRGRGGFVRCPPARPWGVVLVRGGTLSWGSFARRTSSAV